MQQKIKNRAASYREIFTRSPSAMARGDRWDKRHRHGGRESESNRKRDSVLLLLSRALDPSLSSLPHLPPSVSSTATTSSSSFSRATSQHCGRRLSSCSTVGRLPHLNSNRRISVRKNIQACEQKKMEGLKDCEEIKMDGTRCGCELGITYCLKLNA